MRTWTPGGFDPWITLAAKLILLTSMMVRGIDYLTGDAPETARRLSTFESAAPLWLWGLVFVIGATLGFVSMLCRWAPGVLWSHAIGAVGYLALAAGLAADVVERAEQPVSWLFTLGGVAVAGLVAGPFAATFAAKGNYYPVIAVTFIVSVTVGVLSMPFDGLRNATIFICLAVLHLLMTVGTASRMRQLVVLEARYG